MSQDQIIENAMKGVGFIGNNSGLSSSAGYPGQQQAHTRNQLNSTRNQQGVNTGQQGVNTGKQGVNCCQNAVPLLSEQGHQAKKDIEILVATGKTKDLTGKALTFNDLDKMFEKELLKYHRIYQNAVAARVNDTFSKIAAKSYARLASWLLPISDENKLYNDLKNDYILTSELERWTGWLALKMGGLMAVTSVSLITMGNFDIREINEEEQPVDQEPANQSSEKIPQINECDRERRTEQH